MNIVPYLINPYISSGVVATVFSVAILVVVIRHMNAIGKSLAQLHARVMTRTGFFWSVNLVFMAVSILHAGIFFGITGNGRDVPVVAQYLGFAVSFFLDLVTIVLIQAMLEARYRGEELRARQFLAFIAICCATSTFANLAISLNDFDAHIVLPHAPLWVQVSSPYVLASFPLFVIMMSIAAELIINVRPLDSLNEDEYEADEKKRLNILQIRNTYLQKQVDEELRALTIQAQMRANQRLRKGQWAKSFRWFWEKPLSADIVIASVTTQLKAMYEPRIEELQRRLEDVQQQVTMPPVQDAWWWQTAEQQESTSSLLAGQQKLPDTSELQPRSQSGILTALKNRERSDVSVSQKTGKMQALREVMEVVKRYPKVAAEWLEKGTKSASLDEIAEVTGHSRRQLSQASFQHATRNKDLILIASVFEWLKTAPLPENSDAFQVEKDADEDDEKRAQNGHSMVQTDEWAFQ
ncbi:MAG: hypothetical protein E6J34_08915 [Chloroflexi bacterium]|nr:MAG: hypothetical protein E6J34_08915 [Chloroflexota bacterium]